ncbi:MAG: dienelactone hydrolase family protein [Armatimonadetes bacterium]|nr:dienelactone hydrolase family protein [Armatimonadota bacterium]
MFVAIASLLISLAGSLPAMQNATEEPKPILNSQTALPNTRLLNQTGDIASVLVEGVDGFLLKEIEKAEKSRTELFRHEYASSATYPGFVQKNRERLALMLGVRDARISFDSPELVGTLEHPALVAEGANYRVYAVRWKVLDGLNSEGLLLTPKRGKPKARIVAIPDTTQTPEQITGLTTGVVPEAQYARRLAESGCEVLVPALISRREHPKYSKLNYREFLYRSAFELGRQLVGYEVQKILAGIDWFAKAKDSVKIGVMGWGDGGMLALYAGALDTRIDSTLVSGYFDNHNRSWNEPIDRNIFGRLERFGDAELASMVSPRALTIEACKFPEQTIPGGRGAPAKVVTPPMSSVQNEAAKASALVQHFTQKPPLELVISEDGHGAFGTQAGLESFLHKLHAMLADGSASPRMKAPLENPIERENRLITEIDRFNQHLLLISADVRRGFMKRLDKSSLANYEKSAEEYREIFSKEVIGQFDTPLLPANPHTRLAYEAEKWRGYEVVLDVFPGVMAYGILLLPKDLKPNEKRPVVVCQHGLEGRPQHVIGKDNFDYYKAFAAELANRGYITFAPQNLYIFTDRFRTLQRKANPLGKTLFSIIVPQHQQITEWLKTLPNVDGERIAFYGLSYGGKSAMRIPPLVKNYCLSICSADFNEWVWKNASTQSPYSYAINGEYEIFEWDLGSTFNYAEMAALIAPRPFMVERGQFDGVSSDEAVAYEFAKVRHLYQAELGIGDRCEMEVFTGPHSINGKGTFAFLSKHLRWK